MATQEDLIKTAFEAQWRQYMAEVQKMCRVTLLEPYTGNREGIVTMRYGSTDARVAGTPRDGEDDEVIDLTRGVRRVIPGHAVHYHLSFKEVKGYKCECQDEPFDFNETTIMPLPAANIWFGNWQKFGKVYAAGESPDTQDTVEWQKKRLASQWGGYIKRARNPANYTPNDWRTLESVGIPAMPKVEIVRLDSAFRVLPNSTFLPREVYNFEKDVVPDRWSENPAEKIISVTAGDMQRMIAEAVAEQLARGNNLPQKAKSA